NPPRAIRKNPIIIAFPLTPYLAPHPRHTVNPSGTAVPQWPHTFDIHTPSLPDGPARQVDRIVYFVERIVSDGFLLAFPPVRCLHSTTNPSLTPCESRDRRWRNKIHNFVVSF